MKMSGFAGSGRPELRDFRQGVLDIVPVIIAAAPIGLLWGTLAAGKGLSPFESWLMSATVFAGAAQFVAIEMWRDPVPWVLLTVTALIVNVRNVLMGASMSRHMGGIDSRWRPLMMSMMADENWAFAERRALTATLTLAYFLGLSLPLLFVWSTSSLVWASIGRTLGDPAAFGFDFDFFSRVYRHSGGLLERTAHRRRARSQRHRRGIRKTFYAGSLVHRHRWYRWRCGGCDLAPAGG
jgi:predicted branched-subunit amino acid permease